MTKNEYEGSSSTFADTCRKADAKQRAKPRVPHIERLRRLMDDSVSLDLAYRAINDHRRRNAAPTTRRRSHINCAADV